MKKKILLLMCAGLLLCGAGCRKTEEAPAAPEAAKSAAVQDGELIVRLKGNPTTGYTWAWELEGECLTEIEQENYLPDETDEAMDGVGGIFEYRFAPASDGTATLHFRYERSWENEDPAERYDVTVTVSGGEITID